MREKEKKYLRSFLKYAIENKLYTRENIEERYGKDFCVRIVNKKVQKSLDKVSSIMHPYQ